MNNIEIVVLGCAGSGKSTVAESIRDLLKSHGYNVSHDPGIDGPIPQLHRSKREASVKENTVLTIKEVYKSRGSE